MAKITVGELRERLAPLDPTAQIFVSYGEEEGDAFDIIVEVLEGRTSDGPGEVMLTVIDDPAMN